MGTTKVTLRQKPISKGRKSLYLDFYPPISHPKTGKATRREFLRLYVPENPKTPVEKQNKKETLKLAQQIRQKRENELNKPEIYTPFEKQQLKHEELGKRNFIKYFKGLAEDRNGSNYDNWIAALTHLETFAKGKVRFADLDERFCDKYRNYLLAAPSKRSKDETISQNTASSYFNKFKTALKQAYRDGYLQTDLNAKVKSISSGEVEREFLTQAELNRLAKTPCNDPLLKKAALFSALTGLRFSDIKKLVWGELEYSEEQDGWIIKFRQQKTKRVEKHPISEQAYQLLGDPGQPDEKVFNGLKYSAYKNKHLYQWIGAAGITKDITFHCFRHTYAVLQLANGTDIYTVSKMMGHRDLKTTQVYAKIVDKMKREAADKIKLDIK